MVDAWANRLSARPVRRLQNFAAFSPTTRRRAEALRRCRAQPAEAKRRRPTRRYYVSGRRRLSLPSSPGVAMTARSGTRGSSSTEWPVPRCSDWASSSLISPSRISLPRNCSRVGLHIDLFEACSAFTRVAARTLAPSPICDQVHRRLDHFVTSMTRPVAPAEAIRRVGLAPLEIAALSTAHANSGHSATGDRGLGRSRSLAFWAQMRLRPACAGESFRSEPTKTPIRT